MVKRTHKHSILSFALVFAFLLTVLLAPKTAFAVSEEQAMINLTNYVYSEMSEKSYTLEEGGSIKGSDLFEGDGTKGYDLKEGEFSKLSSRAQQEVVSDIAENSNAAVEDEDSAQGVEESTVATWWKQLQTKEGVGSKFMTEILKNTKPDFVAANQIYQPFAGPIGIVMGVISVAMVGILGIVMAADICYITLPPVRLFVSEEDNSKGGKISRSKIFSADAIYAVKESEESNTDGDRKQALGIYFKRRIWMLILLGICLMYLVNGQLYTLVGYILDVVSGFLGF